MGFHLFSNSGQIQYGIKNYIADFKEDLKNIPKNPGNMVFVIEESKYYITNNKQDWIKYKINNSTEESNIEIDIDENGNHDVSFATIANVNVPQGIFPNGTKQINLTSNGTSTENVNEYAEVEITVNTLPEKGLIFQNYDMDGYPHSAKFVGAWTEIPYGYCDSIFNSTSFCNKIIQIHIPETVSTIGTLAFQKCNSLTMLEIPESISSLGASAFLGNTKLKSVIFRGNCPAIPINCFSSCHAVMLYDFSNCTLIPPLYDISSLDHASGCVIRIPAALSDTTLREGNGWESATNWAALTDIVWEVV